MRSFTFSARAVSRSRRRRRGHALATVVIFTTLLSSWYAVASNRIASSLRLHRVQAEHEIAYSGSLQALARTLALLETGFPSTSTMVGSVLVDTVAGQRRYTVTIRYDKHAGYSVAIAPTPPGQQVAPLAVILTATKNPK